MTFLLLFVYHKLKSSSKKQFLNIILFNIDFLSWCCILCVCTFCMCVCLCVLILYMSKGFFLLFYVKD